MRNGERPVGRRENCQIDDIHEKEEGPPHPRPPCLSVDYLVREVGWEDQNEKTKHLEMLGLRGRDRAADGPQAWLPPRPAGTPSLRNAALRPRAGDGDGDFCPLCVPTSSSVSLSLAVRNLWAGRGGQSSLALAAQVWDA